MEAWVPNSKKKKNSATEKCSCPTTFPPLPAPYEKEGQLRHKQIYGYELLCVYRTVN